MSQARRIKHGMQAHIHMQAHKRGTQAHMHSTHTYYAKTDIHMHRHACTAPTNTDMHTLVVLRTQKPYVFDPVQRPLATISDYPRLLIHTINRL